MPVPGSWTFWPRFNGVSGVNPQTVLVCACCCHVLGKLSALINARPLEVCENSGMHEEFETEPASDRCQWLQARRGWLKASQIWSPVYNGPYLLSVLERSDTSDMLQYVTTTRTSVHVDVVPDTLVRTREFPR